MDVDVVIRRACVAAIPALAVAVWWLRADPPKERAERADDEPRLGVDLAPAESTPRAVGEKGIGYQRPPPKSDAPSRLAVDLPLAEDPRRIAALAHRPRSSRHSGRGRRKAACGGLEVRLITRSDDETWSFASVATGPREPAVQRRVGQRVGRWTVDSIEWDRVWFRGAGRRCAVSMHDGTREPQSPAAVDSGIELALVDGGSPLALESVDDSPAAPESPWHVPQAIASAIERVSDTEYSIERAAVAPIFERGDELLEGLTFEPAVRDDIDGLELAGVHADSLLDRLGVEDGDVVLALNGESCATVDRAASALRLVREDERLVVRLDRRGDVFDLEVRVR